jgi:hypothetical protein
MAADRFSQNALNWGEISPSFYGRQDLPQYRAGCSTLRNMFVSPRGGAASRAGTKFVGQCKEAASATSTTPELIPFTFNVSSAYILEFGDFYMRVIKDGAYVTEAAITLEGATTSNPGVFTATAHGLSVGEWVYFADMEGMTELNGRTLRVDTVPTADTFTVESTLSGAPIDTTDFGVYTASSGTVARIYELVTPYAIADVHTLKYAQSADVMSITHPDYKPYDLSRIAENDWSIDLVNFNAAISAPTSLWVTASITTSTTSATKYTYIVTAIDASTDEESIQSTVTSSLNSVNISLTTGSLRLSWSAVTGAGYYNIYKAQPVYGQDPPAGALFGYAATSYGLNWVDTNVTPDFTITPPQHRNPFATSSLITALVTATGSGYTSSINGVNLWPIVAITDTSGLYGTAYAVISAAGGVDAIVITNGGEGYVNPTLTVQAASAGSGAVLAAVSGGALVWTGATTISNGGSGYTQGQVIATAYNRLIGPSYKVYASTITVTAGALTTVTFPKPSDWQYSDVIFEVISSAGSGATATVSIGPSTGTYPSVVAFFQQRRFYGNTDNQPNTFWGSQPGAYANFDQTIPITDSDALEGTPWAQQINGIQWMIPMPGGLVMLTGNGAWQVNGGSAGAPITPINQNATANAYNGVSPDVQPLTINFDILFVQHEGSIVRDLAYSFETNIYSGTDITVFSNHLFDAFTVKRWDWAEERNKLVWLCRSDGAALSLSYLKERGITAWSRHDTNGIFESVACISEPPVNAPYFIVKRYIDGYWAYYVERMDDRNWGDIEDCWCVDAALSYPVQTPAATLTFSSATGDASITEYLVTNGGTGYTSPTGTVVGYLNEGSGATVQLTVSGGIITAATPLVVGSGYTAPVTVTVDDTTGSGAVIQAVVTDYVTVTASTAVFTSDNVSDIIRAGGGKLEVALFISTTEVICNVISPITAVFQNDPNNMPLPARSGDWTIATPTSTVSGLDHLEGMEVNGLADGGVIGVTTVVNGSITLPSSATKIVVGLPYTVQMQTLFLEDPRGTIQGNRQTAMDTVVRVMQSRAFEIGSNQPDQSVQPNFATVPWANMAQIMPRNPHADAGLPEPLYTGDYFTNIPAMWDNNAQIACQQRDPVPLNILSFYPNIKVGDK